MRKKSKRDGAADKFFAKTLADYEEKPLSERDLDMCAVGEVLYKIGGISLMRKVKAGLYAKKVYVGGRWDGIGGWYA